MVSDAATATSRAQKMYPSTAVASDVIIQTFATHVVACLSASTIVRLKSCLHLLH